MFRDAFYVNFLYMRTDVHVPGVAVSFLHFTQKSRSDIALIESVSLVANALVSEFQHIVIAWRLRVSNSALRRFPVCVMGDGIVAEWINKDFSIDQYHVRFARKSLS